MAIFLSIVSIIINMNLIKRIWIGEYENNKGDVDGSK